MDVEEAEKESTLRMYKRALRTRREVFVSETHAWIEAEKGSLAWERDGMRVVFNMTGDGVQLGKGKVLLSSGELENGRVPHWTTVWVQK